MVSLCFGKCCVVYLEEEEDEGVAMSSVVFGAAAVDVDVMNT